MCLPHSLVLEFGVHHVCAGRQRPRRNSMVRFPDFDATKENVFMNSLSRSMLAIVTLVLMVAGGAFAKDKNHHNVVI